MMTTFQRPTTQADSVHHVPYRGGPFTDVSKCIRSFSRYPAESESHIIVKTWRLRRKSTTDTREFKKILCGRLVQWQRLQHPNVAPLMGYLLEKQGPPAVIMPLFTHGNAKDYVRKYPAANIIGLLRDIASGLNFMHSQDPPIAHGTLKASNVLMTDTDSACISDPCINMLPVPPYWTIESAVYARWLAPEIILDEASEPVLASTAGDVYSFGMTAIELFTGHRPFLRLHSRAAVILYLLNGGRPNRPTSEEAPQLTDAAWAVIRHCWKQDPAKRPSANIVYAWMDLIDSQSDR